MRYNIKSNPIKEFKIFIEKINRKNESSKKENKSIDIGYDENYRKYICFDGVLIALDSWNPNADIIYVSHAHMDHIPIIPQKISEKLKNGQIPINFMCSKITKEVAEERTRGKFCFHESLWLFGKDLTHSKSIEYKGVKLTLIENGHTYGSTSLLIEGSEVILYTSDFTTKDREFLNGKRAIKGLKPINCDRLIMECTFGSPNYLFPSFGEIQKELNEYIQNQILEGYPVIILGYSFGKSQIVLNMLYDSYRILLNTNIAKNTDILEKNGIKFTKWEPYGNYNKKKLEDLNDYILIIPPYSMFTEPFKSLISSGAKVISLSGKVLNESYRKEFPADKYIPFSDHCDFNDLIKFVNKCTPKKKYLEHGKIEEFSYFLYRSIRDKKNKSIYTIRN